MKFFTPQNLNKERNFITPENPHAELPVNNNQHTPNSVSSGKPKVKEICPLDYSRSRGSSPWTLGGDLLVSI